ncbi:MAG TPA: gamma-glutamylcyclotransferase family protein [Chthoniobacterales bacterium]
MSEADRERIFLYGTLRRGGSRDVLKHYDGATFVVSAQVRGVLYDLGEYPGVRLDRSAGWVRGELFDVTAEGMAALDDWEGIDPQAPGDGPYRRVRALVERDDDAPDVCWIYEIAKQRCADRPIIASGDWIAHDAARDHGSHG